MRDLEFHTTHAITKTVKKIIRTVADATHTLTRPYATFHLLYGFA